MVTDANLIGEGNEETIEIIKAIARWGMFYSSIIRTKRHCLALKLAFHNSIFNIKMFPCKIPVVPP